MDILLINENELSVIGRSFSFVKVYSVFTNFEIKQHVLPTVFYQIGLRFYFVSFDCSEPPHIHIGDDAAKICKYWLRNGHGELADYAGFNKRELRKIEKIINDKYELLRSTFDEYCKNYKKP